MCRSALTAIVCAAMPALLAAQAAPMAPDTTPKITFGGFVDGYYAFDFNRPATFDRSFTTQAARHNEFNVNLAYVDARLDAPRVRGRLALQVGTSVQSNYAGEPRNGTVSGPDLARLIQEAVVAAKLGHNVWVDGGIFLSHIGMESFISRDNPMYTRSLVADYTPYYESGAKLTWQATPKVTALVAVLNGWQNISETNMDKSTGVRIDFAHSAAMTLSYYNYFGNEAADSARNDQFRFFNGVGLKSRLSPELMVLAQLDYGTQGRASGTGSGSWYGAMLTGRYQATPGTAVVGRVERYDDEDQIIIVTGVADGFRASGASIGLDVTPEPRLLWRTELRGFHSEDHIPEADGKPVEEQLVLRHLARADVLMERRQQPRRDSDFLALVKRQERGKLKLYIGSAAGTGKTYRMINEGHDLRRRGIDVVIGFVETHKRVETEAQLRDSELVPRQRIEYRGVALEEMDVDAVIARRPQVAIVDELAHSNVPGARHRKRWEDVMQLLDEGINVISAVNVQHIESLNDVVASTLGVTVRETVPDWVVASADQVVNLDMSAEDLRQRLREGKIYDPVKVDSALRNFFTDENLTTLRELALREVAGAVDRSREEMVRRETGAVPAIAPRTVERVLVAMSSDPPYTAALLRKASRIAGRLNSDWYCVYVQTADERADRIDSTVQRHLVANIQLAQSMGAEVLKLEGDDVAGVLAAFAAKKGVTLLIVGQSRRSWLHHFTKGSVVERLVNNAVGLDVLVVSFDPARPAGDAV